MFAPRWSSILADATLVPQPRLLLRHPTLGRPEACDDLAPVGGHAKHALLDTLVKPLPPAELRRPFSRDWKMLVSGVLVPAG